MLHLLGISFRSAREDVREGLAFTGSEVSALLASARAALPRVEVLVVSTCNRTEFYLAGAGDLVEDWHRVLRTFRPTAPSLDATCDRYHLTGESAYRHLLRVACGLDSAVLGDSQVLGQLRQAVARAQQAGTLRPVLSPATASALRLGRRARAETEIGRGAPGVGAAVTQALLSRDVPAQARVLVLGTGQAARTISRRLLKSGYKHLLLSGRDEGAAAVIAAECGGAVVPWQHREHARADVVVAATAARQPLVRKEPEGAWLVVDAGFPRQVRLEGPTDVEVVPLLALAQEADEASEARQAAVPAVEALVEAETARWRRAQELAPVERAIKALHQEADRLTRSTAAWLAHAHGWSQAEVERVLGAGVRRALHQHVTHLRTSAAR